MNADDVGRQMAASGTIVLIQTRGRISGRPVTAAAGFIPGDDGAILVAAGDPDADWARNLEADAFCRVTIGGRTWEARAETLTAIEAAAVVRDLILRYGTPAERLGRGPAFRLRPAVAASSAGISDPDK